MTIVRKLFPVVAVLVGVAALPAVAQPTDVIAQLENGSWGWEDGENTCELNPQKFEFSQDRTSVSISWAHEHKPAVYVIERMTGNGFIAEIVGETRLTDKGTPVRWQLVLFSSDAFCWHRMDWQFLACTKPQLRCSSAQPTS